MKITIEVDNEMEAARMLKSFDMAVVLFEITANLKKKCKNKDTSEYLDTFSGGIELVFDEISELLEDHNIDIEDIIN